MIGKRKKKNAQEEAPTEPAVPSVQGATRSHNIFSYYLPVILVAVAAIAIFTLASSWLTSKAAAERQQRLTRSLAAAVQQDVADLVRGKVALVTALAGEPRLGRLSEEVSELEKTAKALQKRLHGATRVVVVPARWNDEKVLKALSGSYAAADMFQEVLKDRKVVPAEMIKDRGGKQHLVIAAPVIARNRVTAVLFAGFPLEEIQRRFTGLQVTDAYVALAQVYAGGNLLLASAGDRSLEDTAGSFDVPGTIWQVRYAAPAVAGIAWPLLLSLVVGGAVLLLAVTLLGYRRLARDCKADMGLMVALVDATLKRTGAATPTPHLAEAQPAMELLARYAQATFSAEKAGHTVENRAGMGQIIVEEVEAEAVQAIEPLAEERLPLSIFHRSVIRGRSGMDFDEEVAQAIGLAVGSVVREKGDKEVLVGRDNRATSDAYASALVAGLLASGCDVVDMGEVPAPVLNYALFNSAATSGVMVTGGHNPPEYNGFKVYVDGQPFTENDYLELRQRILDARFEKGVGNLHSHDFVPEYLRHVTGDVQLVEPLKLVLDCGNGVAGPVARQLFEELGCEVTPLFCEPDGGFPNHLADPSDEGNLQALVLEVQAQGAQLGIALDVDGDALALVDEGGRIVHADHMLMLLAADIIRRNPGADVVYDVACSAMLPEYILSNGGRPIMWRTGHAEIQSKLKENSGLLAGELSGHVYINDRWYGFDDGMYVAARLLEIFSLDSAPVSTVFEAFSSELVATPLLTLDVPEGKAEQVVSLISSEGDFGEADVIDLDGLRLEYEQAWGLIRPSSTRSALVFRFEARDEEALEEIKERFRRFLDRAAPELQPPF